MTELACTERHIPLPSLAARPKGALNTSTSRTPRCMTRQPVAEVCAVPAASISRHKRCVFGMMQLSLTSTLLVFLALLVLSADLTAASLIASRRCDSVTRTIDDMVGALNERQRRFLLVNANLTSCTPIISRGERCAVSLCQEIMQGTRWGCYLEDSRYPFFGKNMPPKRLRGTRERAILSALDSAGALVKLSRECSRGTTDSFAACSCIQSATNRQDSFAQAAELCAYSEKTMFGPMFIAKNFVDHNEDEICHGTQTHGPDITYCMTNLHNNMVGRKMVVRSVDRRCQCIGVSGSCLHKSCIGYLPDILNDKSIKKDFGRSFNQAKQAYVSTSHSGVKKLVSSATHIPLRSDQLAFFQSSPILCSHNKRPIGPPVGERYCNATAEDGAIGSCHYLCCGGPVETVTEVTERRCNATLVKDGTRYSYQFQVCRDEHLRTKCKSRRPSNRGRRSSGVTTLR